MTPSDQNSKSEHPERQRPTNSHDHDFEEVDLALTDHELTRKNSFDFVIEAKRNNDEIHDLLHGKAQETRLTVPAPTASDTRGQVRRCGEAARHQQESVELTDFSRGRDLEAGLGAGSKRSGKKHASAENCVAM